MAEIEVFTDPARTVAANRSPARWVCVRFGDVFQNIIPVTNAHTCGTGSA
jgi:hypothetical protein